MNNRSQNCFSFLKYALILFYVVFLIVPLCIMLSNIRNADIKETFTSISFINALRNSIFSSVIATSVSVLLSLTAALCLRRTDIKIKNVFLTVFTLPMLLPSVSHAFGLILLFGSNGILTRLLHIPGNIYGFYGVVGALVLYSFPLGTLMFYDVLRYEDYTQYESASVLGISKTRQFISITLPFLKKPLLTVFFAVFTMTFTDYGVPLMIGSKYITLPVIMYNEVIGMLDFAKGSVIALILLLPSLLLFFINKRNVTDNLPLMRKGVKVSTSLGTRAFSYSFCIIVSIVISLIMLSFIYVSFIVKYPQNTSFTLDNFKSILGVGRIKYLFHSLVISFFTALMGTVTAFFSSYITTRTRIKNSSILHYITVSTIAVPGVVLGLAYAFSFKQTPIYGTLFILIAVNTVHFIASPYLMISSSLRKLNENIENVGLTLGVSRLRIIKDVLFPLSLITVIEMFTYFFVNTMVTVSAVSFLTSSANMVLSLMINQFRAQLLLESAAAISFIIFCINILLKIVFVLFKKAIKRKGYLSVL